MTTETLSASIISMADEDANIPSGPPSRSARAMPTATRRVVGAANAAAGVAALLALVGAYGLSERLVAAQEAAPPGAIATEPLLAQWGLDVEISLDMSLLLLGAVAGLVGSLIQQSQVFSQRAGHENLEQGFVWWYLLRPVWSALLGAIVVVAISAGLVSIGDTTTSTAGVTVLTTAGALAGLFTDKVLQRFQDLLGASDPASSTISPNA